MSAAHKRYRPFSERALRVLRVIESDDSKASVRQKFGGIVMAEHVFKHTVRDNDEG